MAGKLKKLTGRHWSKRRIQEWVAFAVRRRRIMVSQDGSSWSQYPSAGSASKFCWDTLVLAPNCFVAYNPCRPLRTAPRTLLCLSSRQKGAPNYYSPHTLSPFSLFGALLRQPISVPPLMITHSPIPSFSFTIPCLPTNTRPPA